MRPESSPELERVFEAQRPRLLRLGYRMLGSKAAADDIVQDAWLKWARVDLTAVHDPAAFLTRVVSRLCLDELKSARVRRERYVGTWLPEPVIEEPEPTIDGDELTLTLMVALERLSPLERAAFLLHDVFGQELDEVAETLNREPAAVRQLASRARRHVQEAKPRFPVDRDEGERIAGAFFSAANTGDLTALRRILADDVVIHSDGGGKVLAFPKPIFGKGHVVRLYDSLFRKYGAGFVQMVEPVWIDGLPGYISCERQQLLQTTAFEIESGRITSIYITRNPDKLLEIYSRIQHHG
jgi:RNA polymerase sigma-70 factor (ECF subfamily)